jgi:hypothetical protein
MCAVAPLRIDDFEPTRRRTRYLRSVSALRACPFCRTLYRPDEGSVCSDCGVALVPMDSLPPSLEAQAEEQLVAAVAPEDEVLPWHAFGRSRGALIALSIAGLCLFFSPWVELIRPESVVRSGYDLARGRAGWLWGGATGFVVLIPLAWTRRTVYRMRGVRIVATLLASLTACQVAMLLLLPPRGHGVPLAIEWRWGIFASGLVSLLATFAAMTLGGVTARIPASAESSAPARRADGRTLH